MRNLCKRVVYPLILWYDNFRRGVFYRDYIESAGKAHVAAPDYMFSLNECAVYLVHVDLFGGSCVETKMILRTPYSYICRRTTCVQTARRRIIVADVDIINVYSIRRSSLFCLFLFVVLPRCYHFELVFGQFFLDWNTGLNRVPSSSFFVIGYVYTEGTRTFVIFISGSP